MIIQVGDTLEAAEQKLVLATLEHCKGNRTHAARMLGISLRSMRDRLKECEEAGHAVPPAVTGWGTANGKSEQARSCANQGGNDGHEEDRQKGDQEVDGQKDQDDEQQA